MNSAFAKGRRALRKPPRIILIRLRQEIRSRFEKYFSRSRQTRLSEQKFVRQLQARNLGELWERLAKRPYPAHLSQQTASELERCCPGAREKIMKGARLAMERCVDVLGTGPVTLGSPIDWLCDFKTGHRWPRAYAKSIEYSNLDRPSDVKVPWEISRLQWLLPTGQAYLLTGDERYAACVRDIILDWLDGNPYAHTVNWSCTMEAAMRIFALTWFFHVFSGSAAWHEETFRFRLLQSIYLHAEYTERHIEISDIAGNHYTADAAALVFAGLFFGQGEHAARWLSLGWKTLCEELPRQVYSDGVDYEASVPYHRLVQELFLFPALYRRLHGLPVDGSYRTRIEAMARFTAAYSAPDGSCPLWGDADDARTLPFGSQPRNDHRYLVGLGAVAWHSDDLARSFSGPLDEIFWIFGPEACDWLSANAGAAEIASEAFPGGGFFIMRNRQDHVFIDCGPVGLGGRGGHGHNDCLSFEAVLDGVRLITDCGAYLYTASAEQRNRFRSTASHNTPCVDGEEINRFIAWNALWTLHYHARPDLRKWTTGADRDKFEGAHAGYRRLPGEVVPVRNIELHHASHTLRIHDSFEGSGTHKVEIPLHLNPGVEAEIVAPDRVSLHADGQVFEIRWEQFSAWELAIEPARISPSYGVAVPSTKLVWRREGLLDSLTIAITPATSSATEKGTAEDYAYTARASHAASVATLICSHGPVIQRADSNPEVAP